MQERRFLVNIKIVRGTVVLLVILVVAWGVIGEIQYGALCSIGNWQIGNLQIALTCPLGYIQRCLAYRELLPQWLPAILAVLVIIILGRIFCDWMCPTVLLSRIFKGKKRENSVVKTLNQAVNRGLYSRYAVLGGVFLSSFLFGLPVFCFVCPIGLFFGFIFAIKNVFFGQLQIVDLILFPTLLAIELYLLKSWCRTICPLGALLSIVSTPNRFLLPTINKDKCLVTDGTSCNICSRVCPEDIKLVDNKNTLSLKDCTKCLECFVKCPAKAIKIRLFVPFRRGKRSAIKVKFTEKCSGIISK